MVEVVGHKLKTHHPVIEPVSDIRMGEIAAMMFDKEEGLFIFATTHLDDMLQAFRARYYAMVR